MKLSIAILLLVVPIFVISLGILYRQSRYYLKQEAVGHAVSVLNTTAQRVHSYLLTVETATLSNSWLVEENIHPDSLLVYSRRVVMFNANVSGCSITTEPYVFAKYGRYFSAYSVRQGDSVVTVREGEYEYFDKVWYKTPRKLGHASWVDPFDDYNEGTLSSEEMIASYCNPLYDKGGKFIGVISTDLSLPRLSQTVQAEHPYPHSYFLMLGDDGRYFVHPDTTRLINKTIFSGVDVRRQQDIIALGHEMTSGHQGSMRVFIDGAPCLVCYQPVDGTSWSLALVCPDNDILRSYNQLTYIIAPLIIIGLLLILLLSLRIVAHAVAPLNRLLLQSKRIAEGHYDETIAHTDRLDAVGQLQNSFADMQASLNRHISDVQQMNVEAEQRNQELLQASQLVEEAGRQKIAFIQNMTHQIRTPLNIIEGFSQIMNDNIRQLPAEEVKNITDMMGHNAKTLSRMVLMLYDSSDVGLAEERSSQRELVSCNEIARESIGHTNDHFPHLQIRFETSLPDTFCIMTNRLYLMRSLREILYNSAKYSDGEHVALLLSETDDAVRFVFEDTGPGIAEEYHDLIYTPFTKVDDLSEGLGLGLPLAKRHIVNLGGRITLDTTYHEGCRFIIELPKRTS